jgi:hypothetical protein
MPEQKASSLLADENEEVVAQEVKDEQEEVKDEEILIK